MNVLNQDNILKLLEGNNRGIKGKPIKNFD